METFPVLYHVRGGGNTMVITPKVLDYKLIRAIDPTNRTTLEAGYVHSRPRFTRASYRIEVVYEPMSVASRDSVKAFETARGVGGEAFYWADAEGDTRTVRIATPIECTPWEETNYLFWTARITFEDV